MRALVLCVFSMCVDISVFYTLLTGDSIHWSTEKQSLTDVIPDPAIVKKCTYICMETAHMCTEV